MGEDQEGGGDCENNVGRGHLEVKVHKKGWEGWTLDCRLFQQ